MASCSLPPLPDAGVLTSGFPDSRTLSNLFISFLMSPILCYSGIAENEFTVSVPCIFSVCIVINSFYPRSQEFVGRHLSSFTKPIFLLSPLLHFCFVFDLLPTLLTFNVLCAPKSSFHHTRSNFSLKCPHPVPLPLEDYHSLTISSWLQTALFPFLYYHGLFLLRPECHQGVLSSFLSFLTHSSNK